MEKGPHSRKKVHFCRKLAHYICLENALFEVCKQLCNHPKRTFSKIFSNRQQQIFKLASCMPVSWSYPLPFLTFVKPYQGSYYPDHTIFSIFLLWRLFLQDMNLTWTQNKPNPNPIQTLPELNSTQTSPNPTWTWPNSTQKLPWIQPVPFLNITWILHKPDLTQPETRNLTQRWPEPKHQTQPEHRWVSKTNALDLVSPMFWTQLWCHLSVRIYLDFS